MTTYKWGMHPNGKPFVIEYGGSRGIRWHSGAGAECIRDQVVRKPSPGKADGTTVREAVAGLNAAAGLASSIGVVASVWEQRQARLALEHAVNVTERLDLTYRILDRWVSAHAAADHLDLELSNYVGREALGLAGLIAQKSGGPVVPQSLLYDFAQLRAVMTEARAMTASQFAALRVAGVSHVASPVEGGEPLAINFEWIASLCEPPDVEWERAVNAKSVKPFEEAFLLGGRPRSEVLKRVFNITEPKLAIGLEQVLSWAAVVTVAVPVVGGVIGGAIGAAVYAAYSASRDSNDAGAKDALRELVLLAADVARLRLLSDAWQIIAQCGQVTTDQVLLALDAGGVALPSLVDSTGHAVLASEVAMTSARCAPLLQQDGKHVSEPAPLLPSR